MGTRTNVVGQLKARYFKGGSVAWQVVSDLLIDGNYERAAALLQQNRAAFEQGSDPVFASILAAVHQLCLACKQHRIEIKQHQQAYEGAVERERELRRQLAEILDSAGQYSTSRQAAEPYISELASTPLNKVEELEVGAGDGRTLWQRVRTLLGRKSSNPTQPQIPVVFAKSVARETAVPPDVTQQEKNSPSLAVYCLGLFRIYQDDHLISDWSGLKGQLIFKYLIAHVGKPIPKDILMDVFWPDADPEATRRNLHQAIYSLRQVLRRGHPDFQHIQFENDCYLLNPVESY